MPRHNVNRKATIAFEGREASCTIRNISPIGAALDVSSAVSIPHEITLLMVNGRLTQHCYVVWRKPRCLGVTFDRLNEPNVADPNIAQVANSNRRQRVEAVVEKFNDMREDLDKERKFMGRQWAKRETQIVAVVESTVGMVGDLQAIAGKAMPEIASLEAPLLEGAENAAA